MRIALLVGLSFVAAGCIVLPFGVPPTELELGPGLRSVQPAPNAPAKVGADLQLRVGVNPLQLFPERALRPVDFGVGFMLDTDLVSTQRGGYVEGMVMVYRHPVGDGVWRFGPRAQLRLLYDPALHGFGQGVALQVCAEYATFFDGDFSSSDENGSAFGHAYGEGALGFYLEGAAGEIRSERTWTMSVGLVARIPLSGGIYFGWWR